MPSVTLRGRDHYCDLTDEELGLKVVNKHAEDGTAENLGSKQVHPIWGTFCRSKLLSLINHSEDILLFFSVSFTLGIWAVISFHKGSLDLGRKRRRLRVELWLMDPGRGSWEDPQWNGRVFQGEGTREARKERASRRQSQAFPDHMEQLAWVLARVKMTTVGEARGEGACLKKKQLKISAMWHSFGETRLVTSSVT